MVADLQKILSFRLAVSEWAHYDTAMKSLHIRDVPETTIEHLKRRAIRHYRSLQGELQFLLAEAAKQTVAEDAEEFSLHTVKTSGDQNWSREGIYAH
jgi:plasmid stability protein